jgi:hypothetical protein
MRWEWYVARTWKKAGKVRTSNIVTRSYNLCCNGNAEMRSLGIVEIHVTVNSIKILSVVRQCLCGEFMSSASTNLTQVSIFCAILTKPEISRQIFREVPDIKFQGNPSSGSALIRADRRPDNGAFRKYANAPKR